MDKEKMGNTIHDHLSYREVLDCSLTIFGVKYIEQRACHFKTLFACKQCWQFFLDCVRNGMQLLCALLAFDVIGKNCLDYSMSSLSFLD